MKKLHYFILISGGLVITLLAACKKSFLEVAPIGSVSQNILANSSGVNGLLIGAYSLLDYTGIPSVNGPYVGNTVLADIPSDEAHTGTIPNGLLASIEGYGWDPTLYPFNYRWQFLYAAIQRTNDVLRTLPLATDLSAEQSTQIKAQARFLRAYYHFEAAKMWRNVPYVDETITYGSGNYNVKNDGPIWPKIEADFKFAADSLTATNADDGRANSWAAKAFLAKVYMFQQKFSDAKPLLEDIINNGVTAGGIKYALADKYWDEFTPEKRNGSESVFAVQMSVHDGSNGLNGNSADSYDGPYGSPATPGYGWLQPSFDFANAFQTDPVSGLPLMDTYKNSPIKTDLGLTSSDPFTPYTGTLDPRLDWNVGRRGIPYLDWGIMPGQSWIRQQFSGGPYVTIKGMVSKATVNADRENRSTNVPYNLIRFADVLLWAAEVEVEIGSLSQAEIYVNLVRARAANPDGFVKKYVDDNDPSKGFSNTPAANYKIGLYNGDFVLNGQSFAREAVRFERKLEFGFEAHRLFDLQRWDNGTGYMADVLNSYLNFETSVPGYNNSYMSGSHFTKGKNEIFPIPQAQIDLSMEEGKASLTQNPGY